MYLTCLLIPSTSYGCIETDWTLKNENMYTDYHTEPHPIHQSMMDSVLLLSSSKMYDAMRNAGL